MQDRPRRRGVTLIETCMVLAVLAVLACTALPGLQQLLEGRRLQAAAVALAADLRLVRTEAHARQHAIRLSFQGDDTASCYVAHSGAAGQCRCLDDGPAACSGGAEPLQVVRFAAEAGTRLRSNVSSILFDPLHGTSTPAGTLRLVGASGREVHQVVNLMGRVRACSPGAAVAGFARC